MDFDEVIHRRVRGGLMHLVVLERHAPVGLALMVPGVPYDLLADSASVEHGVGREVGRREHAVREGWGGGA